MRVLKMEILIPMFYDCTEKWTMRRNSKVKLRPLKPFIQMSSLVRKPSQLTWWFH